MYVRMVEEKIYNYMQSLGVKMEKKDELFELFVAKMILKKHNVDIYQIRKGIVDGGRDEGIDSIYISINNEIINDIESVSEKINSSSKIKIYFIQSKTSPKFEEEAINKLRVGLELIFKTPMVLKNPRLRERALLVYRVWKIWFNLSKREELEIETHYTTMANNNNHVINNENFKIRTDKIENFFREIDLTYSFHYWGCRELDSEYRKGTDYVKELKAIKHFCNFPKREGSVDGFICLVDGKEYLQFITDENGKIEDSIFEENIRDYQGGSKGTNSNIIKTIKENDCGKFWCYNNGITIIAEDRAIGTDSLNLTNYQIINGCQTSYSIYEAFLELTEEEKKEREFELVVKIIILSASEEEATMKIIGNTNSQTKIDDYAFEAYRNIHRSIEEYLKTRGKHPYYYERRQGFYSRRNYPENYILNPKDLLQEFYAIYYKQPSAARNSKSGIFEAFKDTIFKEDVNPDYYWIAHDIYQKVKNYLVNYKEKTDKLGVFIYENASLHFARVIFSLILGKEIKITKHLEYKNLKEKFGMDIISVLDSSSFDIEKYFKIAFRIIRMAFEIIIKKYDDYNYSRLIKKSDLDNTITSLLVRYFKTKDISALSEELNVTVITREMLEKHHMLALMLEDIKRKFEKISRDGDMRYNFYDRTYDIINWTLYFYELQNRDEIIATLKKIAEDQDSSNNTWSERMKYAIQVLKEIDNIIGSMNKFNDSINDEKNVTA